MKATPGQQLNLVQAAAAHSHVLRASLLAPHIQALLLDPRPLEDLSFTLEVGVRWPPPAHLRLAGSAEKIWLTCIGLAMRGDADKCSDLLAALFAETVPRLSRQRDAVRIFDELWERQWVLDFRVSAQIRLGLDAPAIAASESQEAYAAKLAWTAVEELRATQSEAESLISWAAGCYRALPRLEGARHLLRHATSRDGRAYWRMADEAAVDARLSCYDAVISALRPERPVMWRHTAGSAEAELRHAAHARFQLPERWVDMHTPTSPDELLALLSLLVGLAQEAQWNDHAGRRQQLESMLSDEAFIHAFEQRQAQPVLGAGRAGLAQTVRADVLRERREWTARQASLAPPHTGKIRLDSLFAEYEEAVEHNQDLCRNAEVPLLDIAFFGQVLRPVEFRSAATRWRHRYPTELSEGLEIKARFVVVVWPIDPDIPPDCRHPECQHGQVISAPMIGYADELSHGPFLLVSLAAKWLDPRRHDGQRQPRLRGLILEAQGTDGRPTSWSVALAPRSLRLLERDSGERGAPIYAPGPKRRVGRRRRGTGR